MNVSTSEGKGILSGVQQNSFYPQFHSLLRRGRTKLQRIWPFIVKRFDMALVYSVPTMHISRSSKVSVVILLLQWVSLLVSR
jgi:hypothetical protein